MSKEKSSVEILKDIAKRANWEIEINEQKQHFRAGNTIRNVVIKNNQIKGSYFISAQGTDFDKYRLYSGVFFPITGRDNYKLLIRKRDQLDKFSFRKNRLRFKIGNSSFDSKIHIETNNETETHKLLSSSKVQIQILEFLNITDRLQIGINEINPSFNQELAGKSFLSIFMFMVWMADKSLIDNAFRLGESLKNKLNY